ncbi:hypothetical protein [Gracilibacillus kekensis]|uniref:Uncharacterized protein n=1 Tax=Gracilibacillus kekensis TaxID=1027249 RepID=A0A1M7JUN6_9BACI|nr:hypothetical protein [Gracilibacillus kekensis]SHM56257.1 hypothetical protein SAMN05216179_0467 [Gracilibacillus kekensis]
MLQAVHQRFYIIYGLLFLMFLLALALGSVKVEIVIAIYALLVFMLSWFWASNLFKTISILFFIIGASLSLGSGVSFDEIIRHILTSLPILIFLSLLPWIRTVFKLGTYDQYLAQLLVSKNGDLAQLYSKSIATTYSLLIFLNISAIYLAQELLREKLVSLPEKIRNSFIIETTLRAFSVAIIWSPMEVVVGLTVDGTGVSYLVYLPWLLISSFLIALLDILMSKNRYKGWEIKSASTSIAWSVLWPHLLKMFGMLTVFLVLILSVNKITNMSFILSVTMVIFPFSLIWSVLIGKAGTFLKDGWYSWKNYTNHLQNFAVLFLSLGFFSGGFNNSAVPSLLQQLMGSMQDYLIVVFVFITVIYFVLAMVGVHPIATVAILLEVLQPMFAYVNPLSIGIVLIISALATSASSPYGINATMTSQSMKINPYTITKQNILFSLMMSVIGIAIALIVNG